MTAKEHIQIWFHCYWTLYMHVMQIVTANEAYLSAALSQRCLPVHELNVANVAHSMVEIYFFQTVMIFTYYTLSPKVRMMALHEGTKA